MVMTADTYSHDDIVAAHALGYTDGLSNNLDLPNDSVNFLTADEYDQLSAILSDFISLSHQHLEHFSALPSNRGAADLVSKWMDRAADLRDKIEARA